MSTNRAPAGSGPRDVLYLIDKMGHGGAQTHLLSLVSRLDRTRLRPSVACLHREGELADDVRAAGVALEGLGLRRIYGPAALRAFVRLVRRLRRERPAIVQTYLTSANVFGASAARAAGVPRLLTTRRDRGFGDGRALSLALTLTSRAASRIICVSRDVADVVCRRERVEASKLVVIPNGIDLDRFSPKGRRAETRRRLAVPETVPLVVSVTHLTRVKGVDVLAEAAPAVLAGIPDARFVVVGTGDRASRAAFDRSLGERRVDQSFLLLGDRSDVPDLLEAADLFVLPSRSEGQPNALIEAMAMGLPIVATRVGGIPELVSDGEEALLVPTEAPGALGAACITVLGKPELARRLGGAARARARRDHDASTMVRRYEELYREVLGETVG